MAKIIAFYKEDNKSVVLFDDGSKLFIGKDSLTSSDIVPFIGILSLRRLSLIL